MLVTLYTIRETELRKCPKNTCFRGVQYLLHNLSPIIAYRGTEDQLTTFYNMLT